MLILNDTDISSLTEWKSLVDQMVKAMVAYENGDFVMPERISMNFSNNTLLLMPALSGQFFSTKLVSLFPDNPAKNLPVINGVVVLNDASTGTPLALLNGAKLTAVRTGAVSATGIRFTTPENVTRLGLIGAGVQGMQQVLAATAVRKFSQVLILDRITERVEPFISCLRSMIPGVTVRQAQSPDELAGDSEVVITATNSLKPVLPDDKNLLLNKHIIAIGSYKPQMRELPDSLFKLIDHCFVDVNFALEESGDLIHPIEVGLLKQKQVTPLGKLIRGDVNIDLNHTTLFKSVGMGLFDLFTAEWLYNRARLAGIGEMVRL